MVGWNFLEPLEKVISVKRPQTGSSQAEVSLVKISWRIGTLKYLGQMGPKRALRGQTLPKGPYEAKWDQMGLIFCIHACFHEIKNQV